MSSLGPTTTRFPRTLICGAPIPAAPIPAAPIPAAPIPAAPIPAAPIPAAPIPAAPIPAAPIPAALIFGGLVSGCADCKPPSETVLLDDELSAAQVVDAMEHFQVETAGDVSCAQLCLRTYQDARGWEWIEIDQCTLALDEAAFDAALTEGRQQAPVGDLSCTGVGYEYLCR